MSYQAGILILFAIYTIQNSFHKAGCFHQDRQIWKNILTANIFESGPMPTP
jgi:hypothetical protein